MFEADPKQPLESPDSRKKMIRQIEYYFGDINLGRDKFLLNETKKEEGWVPLDTLLTFPRLAALAKDKTVITDSLIESTSGLIEVNDDKSKIRRTPNLPVPAMNAERRKELANRTVYCKGFARDSDLNYIIDFFSKYDGVEHVVMLMHHDKFAFFREFKGSVFVTFQSVADAENFLNIESVKNQNTELIRKMKKTYLEEKKQEKMEKKKVNVDEIEDFPFGTVVKLTGFTQTQITREHIKMAIENLGISVAFVSFKMGDKSAMVRLSKKGSSLDLWEILWWKECGKKGKLTFFPFPYIHDELDVEMLEIDEEREYFEKAKQELAKNRANQRNRGRGKRSSAGRKRKRTGSCSVRNGGRVKRLHAGRERKRAGSP